MKTVNIKMQSGFTIVEILVIIVTMAILLAVVTLSWDGIQQSAANNERVADAESIARYAETFYQQNASTAYPSYPATTTLNSDFSELINGSLREAVINPQNTDNTSDLVAATSSSTLTQFFVKEWYVYQPFYSNGSLCTVRSDSNPCVKFRLWYLLEGDTVPVIIESKHQQ